MNFSKIVDRTFVPNKFFIREDKENLEKIVRPLEKELENAVRLFSTARNII